MKKALKILGIFFICIFISSPLIADDCSFCRKDHERICRDECRDSSQQNSKGTCEVDCVRRKCQYTCNAKVATASPSPTAVTKQPSQTEESVKTSEKNEVKEVKK